MLELLIGREPGMLPGTSQWSSLGSGLWHHCLEWNVIMLLWRIYAKIKIKQTWSWYIGAGMPEDVRDGIVKKLFVDNQDL